MKKLRKMLGKIDSPYIVSLANLIDTQSKETLANWSMDYAEKHILPIYLKSYPNDDRPFSAIVMARKWLKGEVKFPEVKEIILNACHKASREAEGNPPAQAAARTLGQVASTIHAPKHSLGLAFYGAAAIAYDKVGINESEETYDKIVEIVVADMEKALRAVAK